MARLLSRPRCGRGLAGAQHAAAPRGGAGGTGGTAWLPAHPTQPPAPPASPAGPGVPAPRGAAFGAGLGTGGLDTSANARGPTQPRAQGAGADRSVLGSSAAAADVTAHCGAWSRAWGCTRLAELLGAVAGPVLAPGAGCSAGEEKPSTASPSSPPGLHACPPKQNPSVPGWSRAPSTPKHPSSGGCCVFLTLAQLGRASPLGEHLCHRPGPQGPDGVSPCPLPNRDRATPGLYQAGHRAPLCVGSQSLC